MDPTWSQTYHMVGQGCAQVAARWCVYVVAESWLPDLKLDVGAHVEMQKYGKAGEWR